MQYGNSLWSSAVYNRRLQLSTLRLGAGSTSGELWQQDYAYGNANNGNILSSTLTIPGVAAMTTGYRYDAVNRLTGTVENGDISRVSALCGTPNGAWCVDYGYDARGNRTLSGSQGLGSGIGVPASFDSTNNHILDAGWQYDSRGNVIQRPGASQSDKFVFDAEDRLVTICMGTSGSCSDTTVSAGRTVYGYDADGRRVVKQGVGGTTVYIYDGHGRLAVETGGPGPVSGTRYMMQDHLGSTRVAMGGGGVTERHDFMPFGEEIGVSTGSPRSGVSGYGVDLETRMKFSGKERGDTITEAGLDYFGARYFSGAQGRFTSPDPLLSSGRPEDPQSWNRYAFGLNNPLRFMDPTGMEAISAEECQKNPQCINVGLNIVLDRNADIYDKHGNLQAKYQKELNAQIARAQDEYGSMGVHLDVTYTRGTINSARRRITEGQSATAINIGVTDSEGVASSLFIAASEVRNGVATGVMNLNTADQGTLAHELAHHFAGDTSSGALGGGVNLFTLGSMNAIADYANGFQRSRLSGAPAYSHDSYFGIENDWRNWARRFSSPFAPRPPRAIW